MFIRSERLFLRPAWPEDCEELIGLITDELVVRDVATMHWPLTAEDAQRFIARPNEKLLPHFFITLPTADGARPIGSIGLGRDSNEIEIGYWIARRHWGQGYATEATRAVLGLSRALGHQRITATHFADNAASARVLEKTGFRPTGEKRLRYSVGRAGVAPAVTYAADLGELCGGEDPVMRAA
jgi:RimJ/RimL family protein N-acetyltransferase